MKTSMERWLAVAAFCSLGALGGACASGGAGGGATGGNGSGGKIGTGGGVGTGGTGTGTATGGGTGTGGRVGTGGSGIADAGTGTGGSPSTDGGVPARFAYNFDTTVQTFSLNTFVPTGQTNLAAPGSGSTPALTFDGAVGSPASGSIKVTATYTDYRQYVDVIVSPIPHLDLTGKILHTKVMVTGTFVGSASLHASSTSGFLYGGGPYAALMPNVWTDLTFDPATVTNAAWNPSDIVQLGIQFYTGDPPAGGVFPGPDNVVFHVDSVTDGVGPGVVSYTFDKTAQSFAYNAFTSAGTGNLAAPDAGSAPTLVWDNVEGNPTAGSLRASVTFTDYQQFVDVILGPIPSADLTAKTLHAKVRLTSGTFGGGATLHASSTSGYVYGGGAYTTLPFNTWTDLTFDVATITAAGWNPADITQIGIQLFTGARPEAGTFVGPNDVVIHIDSFTE